MDAAVSQLLERQVLKPAAGLLAGDAAGELRSGRAPFKPAPAGGAGLNLADAALWLAAGRVHEFSLGNFFEAKRAWDAPLTLLAAMAMAMADSFITNRRPPTYGNSPPPHPPPGCIAWIGRACWPMHQLLAAGSGRRHLFLDPATASEMVWGISEAARCRGVRAIVADAMGLDAVASRRIQLAAERGGCVVLLARPPWENAETSWAATRWRVEPLPSSSAHPTWKMELLRSRGTRPGQDASWIVQWNYEVFSGKGALDISAAVGSGSDAAAIRAAGA